jgi:hypothetical protein
MSKMNENVATEALMHLHTFGFLTDRKVDLVSELFDVDAKAICTECGITYNITEDDR